MSSLTVFLAPPGAAEGIRDVLQDFSAVGLVDPFLWLQDDGGPIGEAVHIAGGRQSGTTVQTILTERAYDRVRLAVIVPLIAGSSTVPISTERSLGELLSSSSGVAQVIRLRLIVVRPGGPESLQPTVIEGTHNLLIAPEDSLGPGRGHILLNPSTDPIDIGRYAAPVVAGVVGLWTGSGHAPFDDTAVLPGESIRMVRSFYRRLDTAEMECGLRNRVFDLQSGLPLPRVNGSTVVYADESLLATQNMANALWSKHHGVLKGPRVSAGTVTDEKIGASRAIKMLLSFLGAALRNAPGQWYAVAVNRVSSATAGAVHGAVYGRVPSAYSVVVNGVTAEGIPANWEQVGLASNQISDVLLDVDANRSHEVRYDLSDLWRDYAAGALTLCDAGDRAQGLPPIQIGASRGVLRSTADAVASEHDAFRVPDSVAPMVETRSVAASDPLGIEDLQRKLLEAERDAGVGHDARQTLGELSRWRARAQRSYGAQVGGTLALALGSARAEAADLLRRIEAAGDIDAIDGAATAKQKRLALWMKVFAGVFLAVLVIAAALTGTKVISFTTGAVIAAVALVSWAVATVWTFMIGQRELFRELNRRRAGVSAVEAAKTNLEAALRDLSRLTEAYGQYLSWSTALAAVLREPFGPDRPEEERRARIDSGLPLNTRLGIARPEESLMSDAALQIRRGLFGAGWLTGPWEGALGGAGEALGPLGHDLRGNPNAMFTQQGKGSGSGLDRWSARIAAGEITLHGSDKLWQNAIGHLDGPGNALSSTLLDRVEVPSEGTPQVSSLTEFMAGVDSGRNPFGIQRFDEVLLTDEARSAGRATVAESSGEPVRTRLGQIAVLTQVSQGLQVYEFVFGDQTEPGPWNGSLPPEPEPPLSDMVF